MIESGSVYKEETHTLIKVHLCITDSKNNEVFWGSTLPVEYGDNSMYILNKTIYIYFFFTSNKQQTATISNYYTLKKGAMYAPTRI